MVKKTKENIIKVSKRIEISSKMVKTCYGLAWCASLQAYFEYYNTRYIKDMLSIRREWAVDGLIIKDGSISATARENSMFDPLREKIDITIDPISKERWEAFKRRFTGNHQVGTELLAGNVPDIVLRDACNLLTGILPLPDEINFETSVMEDCDVLTDGIIAVFYAFASVLDTNPTLLFSIRGVSPDELLSALPMGENAPDQVAIDPSCLKDIFKVDIDELHTDTIPPENTAVPEKPEVTEQTVRWTYGEFSKLCGWGGYDTLSILELLYPTYARSLPKKISKRMLLPEEIWPGINAFEKQIYRTLQKEDDKRINAAQKQIDLILAQSFTDFIPDTRDGWTAGSLARLMKKQDWNSLQMSMRCAVSSKTIDYWLAGSRQIPKCQNLKLSVIENVSEGKYELNAEDYASKYDGRDDRARRAEMVQGDRFPLFRLLVLLARYWIPVPVLASVLKVSDNCIKQWLSEQAKTSRNAIPFLLSIEKKLAKLPEPSPDPKDMTIEAWTPERIKKLRTNMKMDTTQFAAEFHLDKKTIEAWENAARAVSKNAAVKLAQFEKHFQFLYKILEIV